MQQFYNPYMTPQQRLNYLEQQYPQFTQQPMQTTLCAIPVSNIDEANAFRVDLNGTPTLFYNAGNNEVYLKKTNRQTGLADFQIFKRIETTQKNESPQNITTNFEKELKILNEKMDGLYSLFATVQENQKSEQVSEQGSEQVSEQVKISSAKGVKNVK